MMINLTNFKVFFLRILCVISVYSLLPVSVQAASEAVKAEVYGGVVVDQTITMIGQEFYQHFMALWREKENTERFVLSIHERPSARQGSQIWIEFGEKRLFQAPLPSSRSRVRDLSQHAVELTYEQVVDADVQALLFRDLDLGPSEL